MNLGNTSHQTAGIQAAVTITNPPCYTTINVDDSNDGTFQTATLDTNSPGFGRITGLSPAPIIYKFADTGNLNVSTGLAGATVNVLDTGAAGATTLIGNSYVGWASKGWFWYPVATSPNTVNVGNAGSLQGIQGSLAIRCPVAGYPSLGNTYVDIDCSKDTTVRSVNLTASGSWLDMDGLAPSATIAVYAAEIPWVTVTSAPGTLNYYVAPGALFSAIGTVVWDGNHTPSHYVNLS